MNPNIGKEAHKGAAARSEVGKFRVSLNSFKNKDSNITQFRRIPPEVRELFSWFKALTKNEREFLFEMKGVYEVLKGNLLNSDFPKKVESGEKLTKTELDQFKLMIDTLDKAHKMKYGEKKLNVTASYKDIRDAMFEE